MRTLNIQVNVGDCWRSTLFLKSPLAEIAHEDCVFVILNRIASTIDCNTHARGKGNIWVKPRPCTRNLLFAFFYCYDTSVYASQTIELYIKTNHMMKILLVALILILYDNGCSKILLLTCQSISKIQDHTFFEHPLLVNLSKNYQW